MIGVTLNMPSAAEECCKPSGNCQESGHPVLSTFAKLQWGPSSVQGARASNTAEVCEFHNFLSNPLPQPPCSRRSRVVAATKDITNASVLWETIPPWNLCLRRPPPRVSEMFPPMEIYPVCQKLSPHEIYACGSGRHSVCPMCFLPMKNYPTLQCMLLAAAATTGVLHVSSPWETYPWKFTVVTLCALLTHDLLVIAKLLVPSCAGCWFSVAVTHSTRST